MKDLKPSHVDFQERLSKLISDKIAFKMTFSKQRNSSHELKNVYVKTSFLKNEIQYTFTFRYKTRDEIHHFKSDQVLQEYQKLTEEYFYNIVLSTPELEITLLQNKKGNSNIIIKKITSQIEINTDHDHQKTNI